MTAAVHGAADSTAAGIVGTAAPTMLVLLPAPVYFEVGPEEGAMLVVDEFGLAHGEGESLAEALADWVAGARWMYSELEAETELHPGLVRRLGLLRQIFG